MAKTVSEAKVTTRATRAKLEEGKTHWRAIDRHVHLGYRKGVRGGQWLVRWYQGDQKYKQVAIGTADDVIAAGNFDFEAAVREARQTVIDHRTDAARIAAGPIMTVQSAIDQYRDKRDERETAHRGRDAHSSAHRLRNYVSDALAATPLHKITAKALSEWRASIPHAIATRQRLANDMRAALNRAAKDQATRLAIKEGLKKAEEDIGRNATRKNQFLSDDQVRAVVAAAGEIDADFHRLVLVLAATGARFAQVHRLTVGDVSADKLSILMPASRKGRSGAKSRGSKPVPIGKDVLRALMPIIEGRAGNEPLLERWLHKQVAPKVWERDTRGPWRLASEMTRKWAKAVEAAGLPADTVPYALRHSSIVRALTVPLPIRLVAALHDTSIAMIEAHYTHHIADSMSALAATGVISLTADVA